MAADTLDLPAGTPRHLLTAPRPRVVRGADCWWFLGPGGIAKLTEGHLTPDGRLRPTAEDALRAGGLFTVAAYRSYSLTVLTSTACNLGCGYCFQNTGQDVSGGTRPPRIDTASLRTDTITAILDFTADRMRAAGLDRLALMIFGGEPLLNPRGCLELLRRSAEHGLAGAAMTTNGVLLTPTIAVRLAELGLRTAQLTFDGDRDDHDRIRVRRSRRDTATFDTIVTNLARASEVTDIGWTLRVNVSHLNHHGIGDLVDRLAERLDPARCALDLAWVGDIGIGYHNELSRTDDLAAAFGRWQRHALDLGFQVPRPGPDRPCQACSFRDGRYGAVVNADGTLSSCWETAGKPGWTVGTVADGYQPTTETEPRWTSCYAEHQFVDSADSTWRFQDRVDAELLDYLSTTGRL